MSIDLKALLGPVVQSIAELLFPDRADVIRASVTRSPTGAEVRQEGAVIVGIEALVEWQPSGQRAAPGGIHAEGIDLVRITMPGEVPLLDSDSIRLHGSGDVFSVVGITYDPARVLTIVVGRRVTPGSR